MSSADIFIDLVPSASTLVNNAKCWYSTFMPSVNKFMSSTDTQVNIAKCLDEQCFLDLLVTLTRNIKELNITFTKFPS